MQQIQIPPLAEGEVYIGAIGNKTGDVEHIILLPGDNDGATWQAQMDWAKALGGDLPNRIEQAMLWSAHRDLFQREWYWSNELDEDGWAWFQGFGHGGQGYYRQGNEFRASAVRRLPI